MIVVQSKAAEGLSTGENQHMRQVGLTVKAWHQSILVGVVTDLATIDVTARGFELVDVADGHTADEVQALTGAVLR